MSDEQQPEAVTQQQEETKQVTQEPAPQQEQQQEPAQEAEVDEEQLAKEQALAAWTKAVAALQSMDKRALVEVKAFSSPPEAVKDCIMCVCALLGENVKDWKDC